MRYLILALLASAPAQAGRFEPYSLRVEGDVMAVVPADLDGDGKKDLIAAVKRGTAPNEKHFFAIFWNDGGKFASAPKQVFAVDREVCAFDLANVDDRPGDELLLIGHRGVSAVGFMRREVAPPVTLVAEATVFHRADRGSVPRLRITQQIDKQPALLVPTLEGLALYARSNREWRTLGHLEVDLEDAVGLEGSPMQKLNTVVPRINVSFSFPRITVADSDGDGRADLFLTTEDRVTIHKQRADGGFEARPSFGRNFAVRTTAELKDLHSSASLLVQDLNGDGSADLVIHKMVGHGITSASADVFVYFARRQGGYSDNPDQSIHSPGISLVELIDLEGSGKPTIVMPHMNFGVWAIIRILTAHVVNVDLQVFKLTESLSLPNKPTGTRELKFHVSFSDFEMPLASLQGDYNGDRKLDLAFGISANELGIFPAIGGPDIVTKDPIERIKVLARGNMEPVDLDNRGKSDIVISYPDIKGHRSEIAVLFNRGPW